MSENCNFHADGLLNSFGDKLSIFRRKVYDDVCVGMAELLLLLLLAAIIIKTLY